MLYFLMLYPTFPLVFSQEERKANHSVFCWAKDSQSRLQILSFLN